MYNCANQSIINQSINQSVINKFLNQSLTFRHILFKLVTPVSHFFISHCPICKLFFFLLSFKVTQIKSPVEFSDCYLPTFTVFIGCA